MNSEGQRTIVVGVDGSKGSQEALRWAQREAELHGSRIHAVRAWEPYAGAWASPLGGFPAAAWSHSDAAHDALAELEKFIDRTIDGHNGVVVEASSVIGNPARMLMEIAERDQAEMLVVGSRGLGGFGRLMLGSTSEQCATHAHCPVMIVRPVEAPKKGENS